MKKNNNDIIFVHCSDDGYEVLDSRMVLVPYFYALFLEIVSDF